MGDERTNAVRDGLIAGSPQHEGIIRTRDDVVEAWCKEHGITKDEITLPQLLEIRALPEWQNAT